MKSIIFTLSIMLSFGAAASGLDRYYQPEYEIVSATPMCPPTIPGGAVCYGIGTIVTIKATLNGCLDSVVLFEKQIEKVDGSINIHLAAVAKFPAANATVRCVKLPESVKTILLPYQSYDEINLVTSEI